MTRKSPRVIESDSVIEFVTSQFTRRLEAWGTYLICGTWRNSSGICTYLIYGTGRNSSRICTYLIYGTELCHIPLPNFVDIGRLHFILSALLHYRHICRMFILDTFTGFLCVLCFCHILPYLSNIETYIRLQYTVGTSLVIWFWQILALVYKERNQFQNT